MSTELDQATEHPQLEVQRKLGRCLLLLQYVEYLMKDILVQHKLSGASSELENAQRKNVDKVAVQTMGPLVKKLKRSFLATSSEPKETEKTAAITKDWIGTHFSIQMSAENHARLTGELDDLVRQRNDLVHHFIEKFDVWSEPGCQRAEAFLDEYLTRIESVYQQVAKWHEGVLRSKSMLASVMENPAVTDLMVQGIAPDGQVAIWAFTTVVELLREAESSLAETGWTPLQEAKRFILERDPEQIPEKYGCRSWQELLHKSDLFTIEKRVCKNSTDKQRCYRSK